jgi:hypothetical protein
MMCELCEKEERGEEITAEDIVAALSATLGPLIDYFDEYQTPSEADLTGTSTYGDWKVSIAKVGGGTVGKTYPAGEGWILQAYENGELADSLVGNPPYEMTHEQALREAAEYWFDYQG